MLIFVRHPKTIYNGAPGVERIRGWIDVPLAPGAEDECQRTASQLAGLPVSRIYTSDLLRAKTMASAIVDATKITAHLTPALRPWHLGVYQGQHVTKVLPFITKAMIETPDVPVPEGESFHDFINRFLDFLKPLWPLDEIIVIVSHIRNIMVAKVWSEAGAQDHVDADALSQLVHGMIDPGQIAVVGPDQPFAAVTGMRSADRALVS